MWTECQKRSRRYKLALLITFAVTAFVSEAYGQELVRVETEGIPAVRVIIENGIPRREVLTPTQQQEFIMRIFERDGRYFWTSREMTGNVSQQKRNKYHIHCTERIRVCKSIC